MAVETITPGEIHKHARQWEQTALTTELLLACGVVVLSILGIAGVFPTYLAAIAVIGLGAILLFQGETVVLHYGELLYEAGGASKGGAAEVSRYAVPRKTPSFLRRLQTLGICSDKDRPSKNR